MEGKRRAEVPLTEAQEREAAAMLLPATLPFKLKQAEGRAVRNTKARGADCALCRVHRAHRVSSRLCPCSA
jgi:hypothetical protein